MAQRPVCLYAALGVDATANLDEIRIGFKRRALMTHPDKGGTKEAFHLVLLAFETLSDTARRSRYDQRFASVHRGRPDSARRQSGGKASHAAEAEARKASSNEGPSADSSHVGTPPPDQGGRGDHAQQRPDSDAPRPQHSAEADAKPPPSPRGGQRGGKRRHKSLEEILAGLHEQLRRMTPEARQATLSGRLSQPQRLALEAWILCRRSLAVPGPGAASAGGSGSASCAGSGSSSASSDEEGGPPGLADGGAEHGALDWLPPLALCDGRPEVAAGGEPAPSELSAPEGDSEDGSTSGDDREAEPGPLEEPPAAGPGGRPAGRLHLRGMTSFEVRGVMFHRAGISLRRLEITTRADRDLAVVLDYHVALTALRQRVLGGAPGGSFEGRLRAALAEVLQEYGLTNTIMGLRYKVSFRHECVGRTLATPNTADLDAALATWQQINGMLRTVQGTNQFTFFHRTPKEIWAEWGRLRELYAATAAAAGRDGAQLATKLDELEGAAHVRMEGLLAVWNRNQMAREERRQHALGRLLRRRELWERRQLAREDQLAHKHASQLGKKERASLCAERQVQRFLAAWAKLEGRQARDAQREQARSARRRRDERLAGARAEREGRARLRAARRERWRWLRSDLTMEQLLGR